MPINIAWDTTITVEDASIAVMFLDPGPTDDYSTTLGHVTKGIRQKEKEFISTVSHKEFA